MACNEIAALRLALMGVLGIHDESEKAHELAELGESANKPGPLCSLSGAKDLASMKKFYESSLAGLQEKVAKTAPSDPKLPYYQSLMVLTKKVEFDLQNHIDSLTRFYKNLDEMHDLVHEIHPPVKA